MAWKVHRHSSEATSHGGSKLQSIFGRASIWVTIAAARKTTISAMARTFRPLRSSLRSTARSAAWPSRASAGIALAHPVEVAAHRAQRVGHRLVEGAGVHGVRAHGPQGAAAQHPAHPAPAVGLGAAQ